MEHLGRVRLAATARSRPHAFVACAAGQSAQCNADNRVGVWAWRADELRNPDENLDAPQHFLHETFNATAIDVGVIEDEDLIAVAETDLRPATERHNAVLRVYRPNADRTAAELCWESRISGVGGVHSLQFADLDGDGTHELIACIGGQGIYVFALASKDRQDQRLP